LSDEGKRSGNPDSGESAREALARARDHARNAAAETIAALRALLDAAALGVTQESAEHHRALATLALALDELRDRLSSDNTDVSSLILDALNSEIRRWEERSQEDPDARAVLRAFLGMREILWEFGVRTEANSASAPSAGATTRHEPKPARRKRVQRVEVER
jgi:hypothetical protein